MTAQTIFVLAASPLVGSFIANFVARFPTEQSVFSGRSACPHCASKLAIRDLVPLWSWISSSGRCRHCRRPIAAFYPLIELAAVAVALAAAAATSGWLLWVTCGLGWTLLALAAVDFRYFVLPDALTLPLIPAGLAVAYLQEPAELMTHVIGALAGALLFLLVRALYFRLRAREGLGLGDAKLLAACGAWAAWQALPDIILVAAAAGLAAALAGRLLGRPLSLSDRMPFGTFLCFALWFEWLCGTGIS
jgi:leader peptidase (prepilin peptidase)/N-methyltransferase